MKKQYILTFYKLVNPAIDFPIRIQHKGWFGYDYTMKESVFYATRLTLLQGLWHMLSFKLLSKAGRLRRFKYKKVWGQLVLQKLDSSEISSQNSH